ncbi:MAG: hypothetical protein LBJ89_00175, partial [Holosporales bacterium]|nr:hypothetical protein [Holosporales bacterium]
MNFGVLNRISVFFCINFSLVTITSNLCSSTVAASQEETTKKVDETDERVSSQGFEDSTNSGLELGFD